MTTRDRGRYQQAAYDQSATTVVSLELAALLLLLPTLLSSSGIQSNMSLKTGSSEEMLHEKLHLLINQVLEFVQHPELDDPDKSRQAIADMGRRF